VKNIYRVLLTRGMKGCYVYFMDKDTERFVRTRIETLPDRVDSSSSAQPEYPTTGGP
jgi:hypothetical protein